MIQAPSGPAPRATSPARPDPLAAPLAALRAELHARAESSQTGTMTTITQATLSATLARLERADLTVRNAAAVLSGWGGAGPTHTPRLRLVASGTCQHQRVVEDIGTAVDSGQTVLVISGDPVARPACIRAGIDPADPPEVAVLEAASVARNLAERAYRGAAERHSGARQALRQLDPVVEHLRALERTFARLLATDREASADRAGRRPTRR